MFGVKVSYLIFYHKTQNLKNYLHLKSLLLAPISVSKDFEFWLNSMILAIYHKPKKNKIHLQTYLWLNNIVGIWLTILSNAFLSRKFACCDSNFTGAGETTSSEQEVGFGSGKCLIPNSREDITLNSVDPVHRRIYLSLGLNELIAQLVSGVSFPLQLDMHK